MTVAPTHYGEIKRFSEMHPVFMNAAMQFNNETLTPLYKLIIGKSGESNVLEEYYSSAFQYLPIVAVFLVMSIYFYYLVSMIGYMFRKVT